MEKLFGKFILPCSHLLKALPGQIRLRPRLKGFGLRPKAHKVPGVPVVVVTRTMRPRTTVRENDMVAPLKALSQNRIASFGEMTSS